MKLETVNYLLSVHILKELREKKLITEEEYRKIDALNQSTFA
ncbi:SHOCT domain-containing protein [Schinkia azotoformans]|nr:SHOCT domain-containing protein [Schinkia azotoformans]MEC1788646.1 hypothetical protein [Schinkia azotoformans]MED4419965.1 hypothetical protein [Schinkia azotoformans]